MAHKLRDSGQLQLRELDTTWCAEHVLVEHAAQPAVSVNPEIVFKPAGCALLGFCVCGHRLCVQQHEKLVKCLKSYFTGTQKDPSEQRVRLGARAIVLRLCSSDMRDNYQVGLYLHAGFTNFKTWAMCCLRLHPYHRLATGRLLLEARGADGEMEMEAIETRMLLQFMLRHVDPQLEWHVECYNIVESRELVDEDMMAPRFVEVAKEHEACFWAGAEKELQQISRKRKGGSRTGSRPSTAAPTSCMPRPLRSTRPQTRHAGRRPCGSQ